MTSDRRMSLVFRVILLKKLEDWWEVLMSIPRVAHDAIDLMCDWTEGYRSGRTSCCRLGKWQILIQSNKSMDSIIITDFHFGARRWYLLSVLQPLSQHAQASRYKQNRYAVSIFAKQFFFGVSHKSTTRTHHVRFNSKDNFYYLHTTSGLIYRNLVFKFEAGHLSQLCVC